MDSNLPDRDRLLIDRWTAILEGYEPGQSTDKSTDYAQILDEVKSAEISDGARTEMVGALRERALDASTARDAMSLFADPNVAIIAQFPETEEKSQDAPRFVWHPDRGFISEIAGGVVADGWVEPLAASQIDGWHHRIDGHEIVVMFAGPHTETPYMWFDADRVDFADLELIHNRISNKTRSLKITQGDATLIDATYDVEYYFMYDLHPPDHPEFWGEDLDQFDFAAAISAAGNRALGTQTIPLEPEGGYKSPEEVAANLNAMTERWEAKSEQRAEQDPGPSLR